MRMKLEVLLFKKVFVWVLGVALFVAAIGTFFFGALVADDISGKKRFGALSAVAGNIAQVPETVLYLLTADHPILALNADRFADRAGWRAPEGADRVPGYLLLSRYNGTDNRHAVELVRLADQQVLHIWQPDADSMLEGVAHTSKVASHNRWNTPLYRAIHPVSTVFHHSTQPNGDGTYWIPTTNEPSSLQAGADFIDDAATLVNDQGEILESHSIAQAMIDNGLMHLIFTAGGYNKDPIHLNDIEPVFEDGPYWKAGDLLLSMRPTSMIMLYRPSTREVIWYKQGPWMAQHDVDIVNDHTISVFSNNAFDRGLGGYVDGVSEVLHYDFATDAVSSPFRQAMEEHDVFTLSEGLTDAVSEDVIMVEEENSGRILFVNQTGELLVEFVNRAENGHTYRLGWSRYLSQADGDALADALAQSECSTQKLAMR